MGALQPERQEVKRAPQVGAWQTTIKMDAGSLPVLGAGFDCAILDDTTGVMHGQLAA